jgi:hypothetical protein
MLPSVDWVSDLNPPYMFTYYDITTKARRHQEIVGFVPFVSWSLGGEKSSNHGERISTGKCVGVFGKRCTKV